MEREALSAGRAQFDTLIEMTQVSTMLTCSLYNDKAPSLSFPPPLLQWHRPILFSGAIELIKKGSESEQMNIQVSETGEEGAA